MAEPAHSLEQAIAVYEAMRAELLRQSRGKYVLICGNAIDVFDGEDNAFRAGYDRFGNVPFLVREIAEKDPRLIARSVHVHATR